MAAEPDGYAEGWRAEAAACSCVSSSIGPRHADRPGWPLSAKKHRANPRRIASAGMGQDPEYFVSACPLRSKRPFPTRHRVAPFCGAVSHDARYWSSRGGEDAIATIQCLSINGADTMSTGSAKDKPQQAFESAPITNHAQTPRMPHFSEITDSQLRDNRRSIHFCYQTAHQLRGDCVNRFRRFDAPRRRTSSSLPSSERNRVITFSNIFLSLSSCRPVMSWCQGHPDMSGEGAKVPALPTPLSLQQ